MRRAAAADARQGIKKGNKRRRNASDGFPSFLALRPQPEQGVSDYQLMHATLSTDHLGGQWAWIRPGGAAGSISRCERSARGRVGVSSVLQRPQACSSSARPLYCFFRELSPRSHGDH
nr:unnamed protein product [Digitaria exilis]